MKLLPLFHGIVKEGKLQLTEPANFKKHLERLEGREVGVTIKKFEEIRTSAENRYYWGVIVKMVSDEIGIIPDEAHELLKGLFLKVGVEFKGKRYEVVKSTASLSIGEFENYCEKIRMWAASELNLKIPLPNEIDLN